MSHRLAQPEEVELAFRALENETEMSEIYMTSDANLKRYSTKYEGCPSLLAYLPSNKQEHV